MMTATFIDFDDSFTYNVIQELEEVGIRVTVKHWLDFEEIPLTDWLVLGPGPGHPDDYQRIFPLVQEWMKQRKKLFGVCLGHQIFWRLQGESVVRSKEPLHGQKVLLKLNSYWASFLKLPPTVFVQRYNSLCVPEQGAPRAPETQNLIQDGEILITRSENVLSYQFHPESLGTSYRRAFFNPLLLY